MSESKVKDTADAVKGIVEAVPVYQDVAQPALQEVGKGLATIAKTVHVALAPVSALVWGFDRIRDYVHERVTEKLKNIPPDKIVSPSPSIAGPALEALRYSGHDADLRELYANLLATSMNARKAQKAHPAFVEILKQLTSDEAKLVRWVHQNKARPIITIDASTTGGAGGSSTWAEYFSLLAEDAECTCPELGEAYITNICRLGLGIVPESGAYVDDSLYERLLASTDLEDYKTSIEKQNRKMHLTKRRLDITPLGAQFITACIEENE